MNIKGLDKAAVLSALFNASSQRGMGFLDQRGASPMTVEEARLVLAEQGLSFDYLRGRVMKVDLADDDLWEGLYDRDNGQGAAERALAPLMTKGAL